MQKRKELLNLKVGQLTFFQTEAQREKKIKNQEAPKAIGQYHIGKAKELE